MTAQPYVENTNSFRIHKFKANIPGLDTEQPPTVEIAFLENLENRISSSGLNNSTTYKNPVNGLKSNHRASYPHLSTLISLIHMRQTDVRPEQL